MLDSWNLPIGVVSFKTIKPVKLIIYLQTLKTYLDLKTSTESTLTMSLVRLFHCIIVLGKIKELKYSYVLSSLVKSTSVDMTIPSSSLGIGLEVKVGINVNLMSTHFVEQSNSYRSFLSL